MIPWYIHPAIASRGLKTPKALDDPSVATRSGGVAVTSVNHGPWCIGLHIYGVIHRVVHRDIHRVVHRVINGLYFEVTTSTFV